MKKYRVTVCRELWGTVEVEAHDPEHAIYLVEEGEHESDFIPNGKIGNTGVYNAEPVES